MRLTRISALIVSIVICPVLLIGSSASSPASHAKAVRTIVRMEHFERQSITFSLAVDGRAACQVALGEPKTYQKRDVCAFDLPPTARELQVTVDIAFSGSRKGERGRGSRTYRLVDLAPVMSPLRDDTRPFGQRVRAFVGATEAFKKTYPALALSLSFKAGKGETAETVKGAEARLGFALPPEHVSFLRDVGTLVIGDSSMTGAKELDRAYQQMIDEWGTSAASLKRTLKPSIAALLQASTILYTEVGDGYAALLYEPALPGRPSACGEQPAFYWLHQDEIDEPMLLTRGDGKTCRSYREVMTWLFMTQGLSGIEDEDRTLAFVDRSAPTTLLLDLRYQHWEQGEIPFVLSPVWDALE